MKLILLLSLVCLSSCSKGQDTARNDSRRINPPPTAEEMSHYRIVQNEAKTAYAVQSTNTSWVDEHAWWQRGNTWNTLRECTNDIHDAVGEWRKRQNPMKWNVLPDASALEKTNYVVQVHDEAKIPTEIVYTLRGQNGAGWFTWTNNLGFGGCITNATFSITTWKTN